MPLNDFLFGKAKSHGVRWCKRCGRKHGGRCDLTRVIRQAKGSGKKVERLMHSSLVNKEGRFINEVNL